MGTSQNIHKPEVADSESSLEVTNRSPNTGKRVLVAVLLLGLCCLPFVFLLRPVSAGVSLHLLKLQRVGDSFVVSFAISNETHCPFGVIPLHLERLEGNAWKELSQGLACYTLSDRNVTAPMLSCTVHKVRGRLRVVGLHQDGITGLRSYVYRIGSRLGGDHMVSLKPFDKTVFRGGPVEVISEEFEEP